ncbi:leucyl aminopeptidase [Aphelenchoides avenae]|nr:leucyl aminopeptidase [Aphelenchus avenae]
MWPLIVAIVALRFPSGSSGSPSNFNQQFEETSQKLIDYITDGPSKNSGYDWLVPLVDDFGHRHLGSKGLEQAIDYTVENLRQDGFDNVHTEDVPGLPHWVRGDDTATMLEPRRLDLHILAVAGATGGDVTAPVVVLTELDQLQAQNVTGRIVVFAQKWQGYWDTIKYRKTAATVQRLGAVGVLVKSIGPFSIASPHTGQGDAGTIPAACIANEEADLLERLYSRNKTIVIRMNIKSRTVGTVTSQNVVFDITGSEQPNEVLLLTGHIDSWDVGQGAMDDGGGMAAVWQAMMALNELSKVDARFKPKRTIRGVFWTAEEQGLLGAKAYHEAHKNGSETYFFVCETDQGAFRPRTKDSVFNFMGSEKQRNRLEQVAQILDTKGIPLSVQNSTYQGDIIFWGRDGVPAVNYVAEKGKDYYFQFHHTMGDYLSVFEEGDIDYTAAIFAVLAHTLGNMESWD